MQRKLWLALATAGMVAAPFAVQANFLDDGKIVVAQGAGGGAGGGGGGGDSSASGGSGDGAGGSSNPPGTVSPGAQRDSVPGADARTPGYGRTNPNVDDPDSKRSRGKSASGRSSESNPAKTRGGTSGQ